MNNKCQKRLHNQFNIITLLATFIICNLTSSTAFSATDTTTLNVSATVGAASACTVTIGDLNFGAYSGSSLTSTFTFDVNCGGAAITWDMQFDGGQSGDRDNRVMGDSSGSGQVLDYQLYGDNALTQPFGTAVTHSAGIGDASGVFFGNIATGLTVPNDTYADIVGVTLTF